MPSNSPEYARKWRLANRARQRKWHRDWVAKNRDHVNELIAAWKKRNKEKVLANGNLNKAIVRGKIIRPDHCERCGLICIPHGHHPDYSKPHEVLWLCAYCHSAEHRRLREKEKEHHECTTPSP